MSHNQPWGTGQGQYPQGGYPPPPPPPGSYGQGGYPQGGYNQGFNQNGSQGGFGAPGSRPPRRPLRHRWWFRYLRRLLVFPALLGLFLLYVHVGQPMLAKAGVKWAQEAEAEPDGISEKSAKAGQCTFDDNALPDGTASGDVDMRIVPCDDARARYKVLGVLPRVYQNEVNATACAKFPGSETSYFEARKGSRGFGLCLEDLKN